MKKLLVIMVILAFVAPAMAADNLSIKGQYYVSGSAPSTATTRPTSIPIGPSACAWCLCLKWPTA